MFSYLHNIRPNNRRSAGATTTATIPTGVLRHYHEPSLIAKESHSTAFHQDASFARTPLPSPISPYPPIIPPISLGASPHESPLESPLSKGIGARSPRLAVEQAEGKFSDQRGASISMPGLTSGDSNTAAVIKTSHHEAQGNQFFQQPSFASGSSQSLQDLESYAQSASIPQSRGNLNTIPQPDRPPPLPPVSHAKSEKPGPAGVNQARHGKIKLNLLNPMSILARRKSSQPTPHAIPDKYSQAKGSGRPAIGLSDDYDPRIRGSIIHDFSAPQTGRTYSSNNTNASTREMASNRNSMGRNQLKLSPDPNLSSPPDDESPHSAERQHTPIFKEHFDDDIERDHGSSIERETHKPSTFMYQVALKESYLEPPPDPSSLPPFARNLASKLSKATEAADQTSFPQSSLEVVHEVSLPVETPPNLPLKSSPPVSPPKVRSRASSNADSTFQSGGLPRRFKSNASRFSFDMAGVGSSAQEKILEERHRQKAKDKARASDASDAFRSDDDWNEEESGETYSDYNSIDDDGDFEESIPGVNADTDEGLGAISRQAVHDLQPLSPTRFPLHGLASQESLGMAPFETLHDSPSQPIYQFDSELLPNPLKQASLDDPSNLPKKAILPSQRPGLAIAASPNDHSHPLPPEEKHEQKFMVPLAGIPRQYDYHEDDDLYFDDGMIEDVEIRDNEAFDESVFDDDTSKVYGLPLRDLKLSYRDHEKSDLPSEKPESEKYEMSDEQLVVSSIDASVSKAPRIGLRSGSNDSLVESSSGTRNSFSQAAGLTQDNLAAYHDALAFAANQAALNGEFTRSDSLTEQGPVELSREPSTGSSAHGKRNQEVSGLPSQFDFQDPDDFDYDDALADDPIIAAANAEALENDDEGFYGQEFGFFARATGSGEYANGGYFGPQGVEGIGRSHSGRVNFQEPSLTPITERSEWSNRNSAISLALHGYSQSAQQAMASPGLAQLADMMSLEEDDLSLSALMKLRREAWGGSTTSLLSSSGNGSQLNLLPANSSASATAATNSALTPNLRSSTHSLGSNNSFNSSDSDGSPSSPTITLPAHKIPQQATPSPSDSPQNKFATFSSTSESTVASIRPRSSHLVDQMKGHSRKGSGAETVSYTHEGDDECGGGGRWVVEKRRVSEGGKVEVLGREVVEGGRI